MGDGGGGGGGVRGGFELEESVGGRGGGKLDESLGGRRGVELDDSDGGTGGGGEPAVELNESVRSRKRKEQTPTVSRRNETRGNNQSINSRPIKQNPIGKDGRENSIQVKVVDDDDDDDDDEKRRNISGSNRIGRSKEQKRGQSKDDRWVKR